MLKVFLLGFFISTIGYGRSLKLVELDEVSVEAYDIISKRDHYFPGMKHKDWGAGANFIIKNHFAEYLYWNNRFHLSSNQTQIKHVGWEFTFGLHLIPDALDVFYFHHSEHTAEEEPIEVFEGKRYRQFPVQDFIGLKLYIFKKK